MDGSSACTVNLTIALPSDCYARLQALANVLGVPIGHASALTIFAGQAAQDAIDAAAVERRAKSQRLIDDLKAIARKPS